MIKLVRVRDSLLKAEDMLFALPDVLDEEKGPYADFLNHISSVRVSMLNELIERAEKQENPPPPDPNSSQSQGQGGSPGQPSSGQGNGQSNAQQGNPNAQSPPRVIRRVRGAAESAWDDLRKRDRGAEALGALKSKYPARYKTLVDQYYRSLQGGKKESE